MEGEVQEWVSSEFRETPEGLVATVAIENQSKLNAISPEVISNLRKTFEDLAKLETLRVVVLRGAGERAFAAGADIRVMQDLSPEDARVFISSLHEAIDAIRRCPVPVIGRLHGYCFGAAVEIASACDFRIADTTLLIGMPEVKVGIPSVIEAALLPQLIGWGKAREMLLTGMNYSAVEARDMGFVQTLTDPSDLDANVDAVVAQILENGPLAVRSQKALLARWEELSLSAAIDEGISFFEEAFRTDEPRRMMKKRLK